MFYLTSRKIHQQFGCRRTPSQESWSSSSGRVPVARSRTFKRGLAAVFVKAVEWNEREREKRGRERGEERICRRGVLWQCYSIIFSSFGMPKRVMRGVQNVCKVKIKKIISLWSETESAEISRGNVSSNSNFSAHRSHGDSSSVTGAW